MISRTYNNWAALAPAIKAADTLKLTRRLRLVSDVVVDGDILFAAGHLITRADWRGLQVQADGSMVHVSWDQNPSVRLDLSTSPERVWW